MFQALNKRRKKRGQSTLEFTVLIIIIIGALLSIQVYIKRAVQGSLKSAADDVSQQQYSPGNTNYVMTTSTHSESLQKQVNGTTTSNLIGNQTTNQTVNMYIINQEYEYWGS